MNLGFFNYCLGKLNNCSRQKNIAHKYQFSHQLLDKKRFNKWRAIKKKWEKKLKKYFDKQRGMR